MSGTTGVVVSYWWFDLLGKKLAGTVAGYGRQWDIGASTPVEIPFVGLYYSLLI